MRTGLTRAGIGRAVVAKLAQRSADVARCIDAALERLDRLDAAFNNASSGKGVLSALADFTEEERRSSSTGG